MTKKKVTTTYRREFSPERSATQPAAVRNFSANLNYRGYRRQVEHGHHRSPFIWDDWEYELENPLEQETPVEDKCRPKRKKKPEMIVQSSSSGSDSSSEGNHSTGSKQAPKDLSRRHTLSDSDSECDCGADLRQAGKVQSPPARFLSDTISKSLKKVSKRSAQVEVDGQRPKSAPIDDSPFVQYGAGDSEEETGNKRTHNVLSRQGVYPTALEARNRHVVSKRLRSPARECKSKTTLHDPKFDIQMNKQTSNWQSEYNKRFRQYLTCHYK
ncbi:centriole, cilia and spindle-associated protein-like [Watersipora subatra]|uniref:centriole, cilia and spindle-associated protein-like n=1 Tax=Watersipora subatra TaxID=2589382 RepID=UPI00355B225D